MGGGGSTAKAKPKFSQKYMIAGELGRGAFSVVRLGVDKVNGEKRAIKIIQMKDLNSEDLSSLQDEINILKGIDNKNIIKLFETFEEGNELFMVTELVEGGELFDRIVAKTSYTEKEARDVIRIVLETIAALHDMDIVHRDLKPENLLLCSDSDTDIKLADFGFAKRISTIKEKEVACGTPGYVAPEILRGDKYGGEVDVWSVGVLCYILLAGYPPFYDDDQKRLFRKIKEGRYYFHEEHWSAASPESMDMIRKMLCVPQSERWTARQLLSHPWIQTDDKLLEGKDLKGAIVTMKKFNARRRLRAAADAVIMANRMKRLIAELTQRKKEMSHVEIVSQIRREDAEATESVSIDEVIAPPKLDTDNSFVFPSLPDGTSEAQ